MPDPVNGQFIKGEKPWNTGKKRPKFSEEWRKRLSEAQKGNTKTRGKHWKIKDTSNMSAAQIGNKKWLGKKHTTEWRMKMSLLRKGTQPPWLVGLRPWNWTETSLRAPYPKEFNKDLKFKVRKRDNFTCCLCKRTEEEEREEFNRSLCVNHINFDKQDCRMENLNTLCSRCNVRINSKRKYWTAYFLEQAYAYKSK